MTTTPASEELKPCPFCGAPGELEDWQSEGGWTVSCGNALNCFAMVQTGGSIREEAVKRWNTRTSPQAESVGDDDKCGICRLITNSCAGDPNQWPIKLPYQGGNGEIQTYHTGCVTKAIASKSAKDGERQALDLVKRLRDTPNWKKESFGDWKDSVTTCDRAPFEAADYIEASLTSKPVDHVPVYPDSPYKVGDLPPQGYSAWHEWACIQHHGGLRQSECPQCNRFWYPQEMEGHDCNVPQKRTDKPDAGVDVDPHEDGFTEEDMAAVGHALMAVIANLPEDRKDWHPADCPTEIVFDLINEIDELKAASGRLPSKAEWMDISTAPKDGTVIDVWLGNADPTDCDFYCTDGTKRSPGWSWRNGKFRPCGGLNITTFVEPTHWQPLPQPPIAGGEE